MPDKASLTDINPANSVNHSDENPSWISRMWEEHVPTSVEVIQSVENGYHSIRTAAHEVYEELPTLPTRGEVVKGLKDGYQDVRDGARDLYRQLPTSDEVGQAISDRAGVVLQGINDGIQYVRDEIDESRRESYKKHLQAIKPFVRQESEGNRLVLPISWDQLEHLLVNGAQTRSDRVRLMWSGLGDAALAGGGMILASGPCAIGSVSGVAIPVCALGYTTGASTLVTGLAQGLTGKEFVEPISHEISNGLVDTGKFTRENADAAASLGMAASGKPLNVTAGVLKDGFRTAELSAKGIIKDEVKELSIDSVNQVRKYQPEISNYNQTVLGEVIESFDSSLLSEQHAGNTQISGSVEDRSKASDNEPSTKKPQKNPKGAFQLKLDAETNNLLYDETKTSARIFKKYGSVVLGVSKKVLIAAINEAFQKKENKERIKDFMGLSSNSMPAYGATLLIFHTYDHDVLYKIYDNHTFNAYKRIAFLIVHKKEFNYSDLPYNPTIPLDDPWDKYHLSEEDFFVIMLPM